MNFELKKLDADSATRESCHVLVVVLIPENIKAAAKPAGRNPRVLVPANPFAQLAAQALRDQVWDGKNGSTLNLFGLAHMTASKVVIVSCATSARKDIHKSVKAALSGSTADQAYQACVLLAPDLQSADGVAAVVEAASEATYAYTTTKSVKKPRCLDTLTIGVGEPKGLQAALSRAVGVMRGVELAKEWANRPSNHARAVDLAKAAQAIAKSAPKLHCEVLGPQEVAKLKMGSFMAVAQGSEEPLRLIVLKYQGAAKSQAPTVLVGKGITFDTGGISLKPGAEMDEMKFDMCGAASVLGTFEALAHIQPKINVIGLIPACDNMPSGRAIKPGDVVTSMSGQTIEILNTDAEGRLILCDALTYAERFKPAVVIDIATLTGACVIALGAVRHGLFSNDNQLAQAIEQAGEGSGDLCWRMPLDEEYAEGLKSNFADVANVAGRAGGSITAAKFLQRFAKDLTWAHLDIAGTAWKSGAAKGATGRPVPLLVAYLLGKAA
jgi:leucyl aminopeptidase